MFARIMISPFHEPSCWFSPCWDCASWADRCQASTLSIVDIPAHQFRHQCGTRCDPNVHPRTRFRRRLGNPIHQWRCLHPGARRFRREL